MFEAIENESFAQREERILAFWQTKKIFEKSLKNRRDAKCFSFYDGPPFATGLPHYGHLLAGTIKDVVPRYKTMKGFYVPRRFGWDCHGLPIENEIEKNFGLKGAVAIENFGIAKFNEQCRQIVLRYTEQWEKTVNRMGRWVDFSQTWKTMDLPFMESVWWVFKQLFDKGLVYEGFKVMPFSAKLGTPLSNFEAGENYKDVDDPSIIVALSLQDEPNTALLIWTTTPWTLISNLAATVGETIDYVKIQDLSDNKYYVLAQAALPRVYKDSEKYRIVGQFKGKDLVGKKYQPLFSYFAHLEKAGAFRVISDDFVTLDDGTGIVHTAPAFGETDFYAGQKAGIPLVCPVDNNGQFTDEIPEYVGLFVKDADKAIIRRLKEQGKIIQHGTIHHRYPFCWRSDTPLIYKTINTWFVAVEKIKDKLLKANAQIHWTPQHLKEGRFGKWLEGARDWAISRNRYWGTPIPIWRSEDGDIKVIGSLAELQELTGHTATDLHRHFIDELTFSLNGKTYRRISEVFDCWFDAGSMPYAQNHYPFENKEFTERTFPADFIAEGLDQTRGWFYTLTILAAALFDQPAFKNVVVNGILLAEDGNKMSKRLKNYPEPELVIHKYGADAVRLYMLSSPAVKADDLRFSEKGVETTLRQVLIPFWNAHVFFLTYARIYQWKPTGNISKPDAVIDQWILSQLNKLIHDVELGMDDYDLSRAVEPFVGFIDQLTNWYIRRSRRRFWEDKDSSDRQQAFATLHTVLIELSKIAAPFIPFISDAVYQSLREKDMPESVHLTDYPKYHQELRNILLEEGMDAIQVAVSLGHSLRKENKLKVRQPLNAVVLAHDEKHLGLLKEQKHLIEEELNVKQVIFCSEQQRQEYVHLSLKPNFRILGKKVGKDMKEVQTMLIQLNEHQVEQAIQQGFINITIQSGELYQLAINEDVEIVRTVKDGYIASVMGDLMIALDIALTDDLLIEGLARELVNKVNTMRREADFSVTDRIKVHLETTDRVKSAIKIHENYIKNEILAVDFVYDRTAHSIDWELNDERCSIALEKI